LDQDAWDSGDMFLGLL